MAETQILGVDFSGAVADDKTWLAEGRLSSTECMIIDRVQPILRDDLLVLLKEVPESTVVALDFPFGLPKVFLEAESIQADTMADVWPKIAGMALNEYKRKCRNYGTHPKRTGDKCYSVSMSALNSRLVPMTYYGITMLYKLDAECRDRWWIPPLHSGAAPPNRVTLLEVMPGAVLHSSMGFDYAIAKGYKNATGSLAARHTIVEGLSQSSSLEISNLKDFRWGFRANDNCLDAVIAAVAAALWAKNQTSFCRPEDYADDAVLKSARLEGWIYAPRPNG